MTGLVPRFTVLDAPESVAGHDADVERPGAFPLDEALGDIRRVEPAVLGEAPGDTEGHIGVVGDRPGGLAVGAVGQHLGDAAVSSLDCVRRGELDRPAERVPAGEPQQYPACACVVSHRGGPCGPSVKLLLLIRVDFTVFRG